MPSTTATLGISIDPIPAVQQQVDALKGDMAMDTGSEAMTLIKPPVNMNQAGYLAAKILENLYNYVNSFVQPNLPLDAISFGNLTDKGYLPVKAFQTWYDNLSRKLSNDPNYLSSDKSA